MIRKLVRQMLAAQIFSALTVSLCLLIDSVMISRFLGEQAIAAYGLANPLLLMIGAIGTLLAGGIQVVCSKALGRSSQEEANAGYSSALAVAGGVSLLFMLLALIFSSFFATVMGAGRSGVLFEQTRDYLAGFSIGAPGSVGALVLVPFLQMAGQSNLLIVAVLAMTVTDVALDLVNALVLHWGMFGMGLASALSYYAAMAVAAVYFCSKKCIFRFSRKGIRKDTIADLFRSGIPAGVNMLASVILVYVMNQLLKAMPTAVHGGAVAAYTVIMSIGNAANCITTGIGGVSLTLNGIFYHEEDKSAMRETVKLLCRRGILLGFVMGALLLVLAPQLIGIFIANEGEVRDMAILGLRLFGAGLIPCCINNALKYAYQASDRPGLTELISLAEGAVFPALAAFVLSRFLGTTGAWMAFAAGEILTLAALGVLIFRITGQKPWDEMAVLLLKKDFGVSPEDMLEMDISSLEEVTEASEKAMEFCRSHDQDTRTANHIALCIEEMAANVIQYGFSRDVKDHHLSVLILDKPDQWVLRLRDDCAAFDPLQFVPKEADRGIGIRLVLAVADEVYYTYSMSLNNLVFKMPKQ